MLAYLLAAFRVWHRHRLRCPWAMVPDIIEFDQAETGERREGSYYAFFSFFQKVATGIAIWGMGQALAATGYITPSRAAAARPTRGGGECHPLFHGAHPGGAAHPGHPLRLAGQHHPRKPPGNGGKIEGRKLKILKAR